MANWDNILSRGNVEDRRSMGPMALGGGMGITGLALLLVVNLLLGGNPGDLLNQLEQVPSQIPRSQTSTKFDGQDSYEVFASKVLGSTNDMWSPLFEQVNRQYAAPKLVLFRAATASSCGTATSQVGPHYCLRDQTIYLDETFFDQLRQQFGAQGGDVAEAYVIAHEVGHHAQQQLGIMDQVERLSRVSPEQSNDLSVKLELQADCFAGLWAYSIKDQNVLNPGEIGEAMDAAAAVGDDRIQEKVSGQVNPESWTHGSSEQRVNWFTRGYEAGLLSSCDTFN
jgi:predicted metalloprotease